MLQIRMAVANTEFIDETQTWRHETPNPHPGHGSQPREGSIGSQAQEDQQGLPVITRATTAVMSIGRTSCKVTT